MESSTKILRRMLNERGVEWWNQTDPEPQTVTMARLGDQLIEYHENVNGTMGYHVWNMRELTPAQTIAATLGDVPRLPYFWTHDGTLHIELPKLPESISVRLPDYRDREVGSARTWQYTQGSGTCRTIYLVEISDDLLESWYTIAVYQCHEAAESRAEALRREVDGVRHFARVSKLEVVDA